jgi:hypothetical protein
VGGWSSFETLEKSYLNILKSESGEYVQKANDYFEENLLSDDAT